MSMQTNPYLKPKKYKTLSESDSNVIISTFKFQGGDMIFLCIFTIASVYHLAKIPKNVYLEYKPKNMRETQEALEDPLVQ